MFRFLFSKDLLYVGGTTKGYIILAIPLIATILSYEFVVTLQALLIAIISFISLLVLLHQIVKHPIGWKGLTYKKTRLFQP